MKKWIIGTAIAGLVAIPALAAMDGHGGMHHMKGPETKADVEAKVKAHFADVDTNKDGAISKEEADAFHAKMAADRNARMFAEIDTDKNGQISREEFDAHHKGMGHGGMRGKGHDEMFSRADANKDGKVTMDEARAQAMAMFDKADTDKNGTVTPEERRAAWHDWRENRHGDQGGEHHH